MHKELDYSGYIEELFKNNPLGILLCNSDNMILRANQAFCEMFGYSEKEILGKHVDDVVIQSPELKANALKATEKAMQGEKVRIEAVRQRKDGSSFWVSILSVPIFTNGIVTGIFAIYSDITERKSLQKNLEEVTKEKTAIIDSFPDYITVVDNQGKILNIYSASLKKDNVDLDGFLHKKFDEIGFPPEELGQIEYWFSEAIKGSKTKAFTISLTISSKKLYLEIRFIKMDEKRVLGVVKDVTEEIENKKRLENFVSFNRSLLEITNKMLKASDVQSSYQLLLERSVEIVPGAEAGSLLLKDPDGYYRFYAAVNYDLDMLKKIYFEPDELLQRETSEIQIITNFTSNRKLDNERYEVLDKFGKTESIKAMLSVPIEIDGRIVGFFGLDSHSHSDAFDNDSVEMAKLLSQQVSVLIERLRLEEELKKQKEQLEWLSGRDPLTNLPNRRLFFEKASAYLSLSKRNHSSLSILYIDLDFFKVINDTMGHDVGDEVLSKVAKRFQQTLRESDVVARIGGDEFIFVLPETDYEAAKVAKKRIEFNLREAMKLKNGIVTVGGSVGIATFPDDGDNLEQLIKIADHRMYEIKHSNRKPGRGKS
ncbi:hypothetical protein AT15_06070 [Kosmotoga arenicorallina S304]|uniref:Diguanylate cyclase n=1 Tax=Kosmotoga arenicorallina S304 TaxID=1453497 RepID=A0A176K3R5_9BACT|nr:sensor domain-containing diguanylate cyclase [Kosmotoga arenicorallina]OAA31637.1 hypothetical protein AT15_06070 [Kosmotoga arenicorallina S304]